jgi:hypothetical protein
MAFELPKLVIPGLVAGADLSSAQFLFGYIDNLGKVQVNTTLGGICDGVIQDKPVADQAVELAPAGVSKVVAGGVVNPGDLVGSDATGKAILAASGTVFRGRALTGSSGANELISVFLGITGVAP